MAALSGDSKQPTLEDRAAEVSSLLTSVLSLITPFIHSADSDAATKPSGHGLTIPGGGPRTVLVEPHPPHKLSSLLGLASPPPNSASATHLAPTTSFPTSPLGASGLLSSASTILAHSVNTWDRGFLSKLYAAPDAPGLAAELLLAALNTNAHVYDVSPALTLVEKHTATQLARLFGLPGKNAGGVSMPGGAASNTAALLIARNALFPRAGREGVAGLPAPLAVFASEDAHYSVSAAAASLGLGSRCVRSVPVDASGAMRVDRLKEQVADAVKGGAQPFFCCATAGTTVLGGFDPLEAVAGVCGEYEMWMHVDACWGGSVVFSEKLRGKLEGSGRADSVSYNPHKMLGVPVTCSFLLGKDMRRFWRAMRLEAGYLFHEDLEDGEGKNAEREGLSGERLESAPAWDQVFDMAMFTPQCGRKADSLKLYLAWQYHGSEGFAAQVERAFEAAAELAEGLGKEKTVRVVSENPPPCCQVCFYYIGDGSRKGDKTRMSRVTRAIVAGLVRKGWMIDYAKGDEGEFMRAVCNRGTGKEIVEGLVKAIVDVGEEVVKGLE